MDSLEQVADRGGGIEIALPTGRAASALSGSTEQPEHTSPADEGDASTSGGSSLIWRVKLLRLAEDEMTIEMPTAMGTPIGLEPGVELIGAVAVGQNRWMFRTRVLGEALGRESGRAVGLRLAMPSGVERCQRRNFYRISTAELNLPGVECWPLLDPSSVVGAELSNRAEIMEHRQAEVTGIRPQRGGEPAVLPEVGPSFHSRLVNVGGGGAGLVVASEDGGAVERARMLWLRVNLTPFVPVPLAVTARVVHTHLDSSMNHYVGVAFEFAFNPAHRAFVVQQVCAYVDALVAKQKSGLRRSA